LGFCEGRLNVYEALWFVPLPIGWTPLTDITDKETNKQTGGQTNTKYKHQLVQLTAAVSRCRLCSLSKTKCTCERC